MNKFFSLIIIFFASFAVSAQDCAIGPISVEILPCGSNGKFNVKINFMYENVGNEGFTVSGNGMNYGSFQYGALPVTVGPFVGNGSSTYEVVVKDKQKPDCQNFKIFGPVQCNVCNIYDLVVDPLECTSDSTYSAIVDFQYENEGTDGFKLYYNGIIFGTYQYNQLPLTISNFPVSSKNYEVLKVIDLQKGDCYDAVEFEGLKCGSQGGGDCIISDLTAVAGDCDTNGVFYVTINFDYQNQGNNGFSVFGNGIVYGSFDYGNLPVVIGPLTGSKGKNWEFAVKDNQYPDCKKAIDIGVVDCDDICDIFDFVITPLECTGDESYAVKLNFKYNDYPDSMFNVYGNGVFLGAYKLKNLPVIITNFPEGGSKVDTIMVCAPDTIPACCHSKTFEGLNCPVNNCKIFEIGVNNIECTSDSTYSAWINFLYQNVSGTGFKVWINSKYLGLYPYSALPLTLDNIPQNGAAGDVIKICDAESTDCCKVYEFAGLTCGSGGDCKIYELTVSNGDCTSDSTYVLVINFLHQNTQSNQFDLKANGKYFGTYLYSQLPLTISNFPKSGGNIDWIKVCDHEEENCCVGKEFETQPCGSGGACKIYELTVSKGDCTSDSTYVLVINFLHQNTQSNQFDLKANGKYFGTYLYSQLPLTISNFPKSGGNVDWIKVCDHEEENCCKEKEFETQSCGSGDCSLYDLTVIIFDCTSDSTYKVKVNFKHKFTQGNGFDLYANGKFFGYYLYSQLPITINNFPASGNVKDVIKVSDNDNEACFTIKEFEAPDCDNENCEIYDLFVDLGDCTSDSTYEILIDFEVQNPGSNSFKLFANGKYFNTYLYSALPITLTNFPISGNNNDWLKVCDGEYEDCCKSKEFKSPECGGMLANIYDLKAAVVSCTNGKFEVEISFEHNLTGTQGYRIMGNGNNYGNFEYSQNPVVIGPFVTDFFTQYEYMVVDNEFTAANDYVNIGYVDCVTSTEEEFAFKNQIKYYFEDQNLVINSTNPEKIMLEVQAYNYLGQLIRKENLNSSKANIDASGWVPGMYLLIVRFSDGHQSMLIPKLR